MDFINGWCVNSDLCDPKTLWQTRRLYCFSLQYDLFFIEKCVKVTLYTSRQSLNATAVCHSSTHFACYWRNYFPLNFFPHMINTRSSRVPKCFVSAISNWHCISNFEFCVRFLRMDTSALITHWIPYQHNIFWSIKCYTMLL